MKQHTGAVELDFPNETAVMNRTLESAEPIYLLLPGAPYKRL